MTPEQLAEIEARANAATEGPWGLQNALDIDDGHVYGRLIVSEIGETLSEREVSSLIYIDRHEQDDNNAAFIAAARTDVPTLIAEVRRLRGEVDHFRAGGLEIMMKSGAVALENDRLRAALDEIAAATERVRGARKSETAADAAYDAAEDAYHASLRSDVATRSALDLAADAHLSARQALDHTLDALVDVCLRITATPGAIRDGEGE